jgi:hypothetical protein
MRPQPGRGATDSRIPSPFSAQPDAAIFAAEFKLSDAQLTIARESGFPQLDPSQKRALKSQSPPIDWTCLITSALRTPSFAAPST